MKNRGSYLFSIVLLLVNAAGAVGALWTTLGVTFGTLLMPMHFLCGMFLLCLLSVTFWSTQSRRRMLYWGIPAVIYLILLLLFWGKLADGMGWALWGLIRKLNSRYDIHLIWNLSREAAFFETGMRDTMVQATWSILAVMLPYVLLLGYAVVRGKILPLLLADALWFVTACAMDEFPAYVWIVLCIQGLTGVIIRSAFRDDEKAGVQAVLIGAAVLGITMAIMYRFAVPFLDGRYDAIQEARIDLSIKINEEWIPWIKYKLSRFGTGPGTDVGGELKRKTGTTYTLDEVYRITFSSAPKSAVYLRGFVGKDYAGDEWKAEKASALEEYYSREGWELPESGRVLINLTYNAFRYRTSGKVSVEELAAPGSYTLYPYGAQIPEEYKTHWDGTVEWKGRSYELFYNAPEDYSSDRRLTGTAARAEERYRIYVYDTFCEYPAEKFPKLTEFLENSGFRTDSVYDSLTDVLSYLRENAVYNLDVPNTPRGEDFVEYFMFESREGYCAHFASSAVLMLRYLGVPARYAAGYAAPLQDFERNADGTYSAVILDKQAHAWAEIYLDGIGWVPVEMTPGAAPFPGDNTAEQLALAGQLTGEEDSGGTAPEGGNLSAGSESLAGQQETAGNDGSEQESLAGADESGEKEQENSAETEESGEAVNSGQKDTGQSAGLQPIGPGTEQQGSNGSGGTAASQPEDGSESNEDHDFIKVRVIFDRIMSVVIPVLQAVGLLLFSVILWKLTWALVLRSCRGRLERAESREKVFLLYRNMRRLLAAAGCAERLNRSDENTAEFNVLLERCSFGEKEPVPEEVQAAREFCEKLAKEVYAGLPLHRKSLVWGLDVYGFVR